MNWTGGRLHLHIKANTNEQVRKQKQHFAKARQEIQHPASTPHPVFSILGEFQSVANFTTSNLKHDYHRSTADARLGQSEPLSSSLTGDNPRIRESPVARLQDLRQGLHTLYRPSLTSVAGPNPNKTATQSTPLSSIFLPGQTGLVSQ